MGSSTSCWLLSAALLLGVGRANAQASSTQAPEPVLAAQAPTSVSPSKEWQYRRFNWLDAGVAGVAGVTVAVTFFLPPPSKANWTGGILFDDAVRDALRAETRNGRDTARTIGDFGYRFLGVAPTLIDGLLVSLWLNDAPDVTGQLLLINLQAYALAGAVLSSSEHLAGRARPSVGPCQDDPEYEEFCGDGDQFNSFISGHSGIAATSAGLTCAHHQFLELYGNPWADAAACIGSVGLALTTGGARLINDRHYMTDLVAAFAVGGLAGYALPTLSFYSNDARTQTEQLRVVALPWAGNDAAGISLSGAF